MEINAEASSEQMKNGYQLGLDINQLEKSVRAEFQKLEPLSGECCIYRAPKPLRKLNRKAFTPQVVSIGPFHRDNKELQAMEEHKKRYLQDFLQWSGVSMRDVLQLIEKNITKLRNCYAETIKLTNDKFAKIILVDAAFVVMVLVKYAHRNLLNSNDRLFNKPWMITHVRLDMCLLENQIPFFILNDLLKLSNKTFNHAADREMIKLTHYFFRTNWYSWVTDDSVEMLIKSSKIEHFTDFLRICQQPPKLDDPRKVLNKLNIPSVTELQQAGVTFKPGLSKNIFDIKFSKGILEIPQLAIEDTTEILFRNLQAFEQCHCQENYVGDYICLIGYLVDAPKDVKILMDNEIVDNWLESAQAASDLFKNLEKENNISNYDFRFAGLLEDLKAYRESIWPGLKVTLRQNYFNNPWASISVIAAVVLFLLTVAQTVLSILQVV